MLTLYYESRAAENHRIARELLLIWQNPRTRQFSRAGLLSVVDDGTYEFQYEKDVVSDPDFFPLDEYPATERTYRSRHLPPFFTNRVMSPDRESYGQYLEWLGLSASSNDVPVEILIRTGGGRATDTFHIVERPVTGSHSFTSRFFVSGIRHQEQGSDLLALLSDGDSLMIEPDPENPHNPDAHLVLKSQGMPIGWVPDWLCGEVAGLSKQGWRFEVTAERINSAAPSHVQLLCRLDAMQLSGELDD